MWLMLMHRGSKPRSCTYQDIKRNIQVLAVMAITLATSAVALQDMPQTSPGDINSSGLKIYQYNETSRTWEALESTVNTSSDIPGYDGYIETTVTDFGYFSYAGRVIPPPPPGQPGSSPYRPYVQRSIPTVILTSSKDWHYAVLAAGPAATNNYVLLVTPPDTLDTDVKNSIQWFRRLVILGDESAISKDVEDNLTYLKKRLEPGFHGMDIVRVNGTGYYETSAMFVDLWRDPSGNLTAKGIILTRSDIFPDALVASQLSAATGSPIIYTTPARLSPWARDRIRELGLDVTIIGGEEAILPEVEDEVKALGVNVTRIGGKDRYETAALVADEYVKAMKESGRDVDTVTFLCGERGRWANTLGFWSYTRNSTILYVRPINDSSAFPAPNKNFINAHPEIKYASIMTEDKIRPQGYSFDDSYIRSAGLEVDRSVWKFYMDIDPDKKNYAFDTNAVKLSIKASQKVRSLLRKAGVLILYNLDGSSESGKDVKGSGDSGGGDGGECC